MRERDVHDDAYRRLAGTRLTEAAARGEVAPRNAASPSPARSTLLPRLALLRPRSTAPRTPPA